MKAGGALFFSTSMIMGMYILHVYMFICICRYAYILIHEMPLWAPLSLLNDQFFV